MSSKKRSKLHLAKNLGLKMNKINSNQYSYGKITVFLNPAEYKVYNMENNELLLSGEYGSVMMKKIREAIEKEGVVL